MVLTFSGLVSVGRIKLECKVRKLLEDLGQGYLVHLGPLYTTVK